MTAGVNFTNIKLTILTNLREVSATMLCGRLPERPAIFGHSARTLLNKQQETYQVNPRDHDDAYALFLLLGCAAACLFVA